MKGIEEAGGIRVFGPALKLDAVAEQIFTDVGIGPGSCGRFGVVGIIEDIAHFGIAFGVGSGHGGGHGGGGAGESGRVGDHDDLVVGTDPALIEESRSANGSGRDGESGRLTVVPLDHTVGLLPRCLCLSALVCVRGRDDIFGTVWYHASIIIPSIRSSASTSRTITRIDARVRVRSILSTIRQNAVEVVDTVRFAWYIADSSAILPLSVVAAVGRWHIFDFAILFGGF